MANVIKYSTTGVANTIKKGNFYLGVNNVGYGPTETTGFWNGIQPPLGGYTLYENKATQGPSIRLFNTDSELISFVNQIGGNVSTIYDAINYFNSNNNFILTNKDYEPIVTDGLVLSLDASFSSSYPKGGNSWKDLSGNGNDGTLVNGPTFISDNGGSILFDGVDDYCDFFAPNLGNTTTVEMWCKIGVGYNGKMFFGWRTYDVFCSSNAIGYNTANSDVYGISSATVSSLGLVNNWNHYVFEMRSDVSYVNNKIYINGVSQTLSQQLGTENSGRRNFNNGNGRISGWRNATGYHIPMDCRVFRVYNRALTPEEIAQNYYANFYQYTNNLQNRVKFDGGFYEDTTNYTTEIIKEI